MWNLWGRYITTAELEELKEQALQDAERRLQMPPVMEQRKEAEHKVLDKDPALIG